MAQDIQALRRPSLELIFLSRSRCNVIRVNPTSHRSLLLLVVRGIDALDS